VRVVVSDSSPLNYLALLSDFDLLHRIYGLVMIPPAVHEEVVERGSGYPVQAAVRAALGNWMEVSAAPDAATAQLFKRQYRLDLGETQAIIVAEVLGSVPLLMDEARGVRCARSLGLTVIRTPLIYAEAKMLGLIGNVREKLDQLRAKGFRLKDEHYERILREVGEPTAES
jgi:hypothetical protein